MIATDEDALICDLAETYHIYDYKQLPPTKVAVFSCGLREDSRIKLKMNNQVVPLETMLLAGVSDRLSTLVWFKTEDGQKGNNKPKSLVEALSSGGKSEENGDMTVFNSGEDFMKKRQQLIRGGGE